MKKILFGIICFATILAIFSFRQNQIDTALARVNKTNSKLAFYWNEPVNDYEVSFTFKNPIPNYNLAVACLPFAAGNVLKA